MYTMVRILPMDQEYEFVQASIKEVQNDFFLKELPSRKDLHGQGKYCYKTKGMQADEGTTLVLFQYDNKIIACSDLYKVIKLEVPEDVYHGAFYFNPSSIKVFDEVSNEDINNIFNCTIKFVQIKHNLDSSYIPAFTNNLNNTRKVDMNNLQINERPTCIPDLRNN